MNKVLSITCCAVVVFASAFAHAANSKFYKVEIVNPKGDITNSWRVAGDGNNNSITTKEAYIEKCIVKDGVPKITPGEVSTGVQFEIQTVKAGQALFKFSRANLRGFDSAVDEFGCRVDLPKTEKYDFTVNLVLNAAGERTTAWYEDGGDTVFVTALP